MAAAILQNHNAHLARTSSCSNCLSSIESSGRFCGECGAPNGPIRQTSHEQSFAASFQRTATISHAHEHHHAVAELKPASSNPPANRVTASTPTFARVKQKTHQQIPAELKEEISQLVIGLARQRLFLLMHWCIFLGMNMTGLLIAYLAYRGYIGDEWTRCVMAFTPMFFINSIALACLSPIKGTKMEVARLKERLTYMRFQVEYLNMV